MVKDERGSWLGLGVAVIVGAIAVVGCGGTYYASVMHGAATRLEQARAAGAERFAPYEYYYAKAHLEQAQVEASEASYSDAANYAETAEEYAAKAIEVAAAARKSAGPR
jgi:hypothetical protein